MEEEQRRLEREAFDIATIKANNQFLNDTESSRGAETNEGILLIKKSLPAVTDKIKEYLESKSLRGKAYATREPIMDYLGNEETLAYIVLSSIFNTLLHNRSKYPPYTVPILVVARTILSAIKQEYRLEQFKDNAPKLDTYIDKKYKTMSVRRRTIKKLTLSKRKLELDEPDNIQGLTLGVNLITAVVKSSAGLCMTRTIRNRNSSRKRVLLSFTQITIDLLNRMRDLSPFFSYSYPIFVIPPKPWTGFGGTGGYYEDLLKIDLVKIYNNRYNKQFVKNYFDSNEMFTSRFTNIVNSIQKVPWKINTKVLDVLETVYSERLNDFSKDYYLLGGVPDDDLPDPEDLMPEVIYTEDNKEEYIAYRDKLLDLEDKLNSIRSKGLGLKLAMSLAKKYRKYNEIYFSYQVDFRGRLYPIQPHLNPQGAKTVKSLLMFAEGKPLDTPEAERWFMIHGANVFGYDKLLYNERIEKMKELHEEIIKISEEPLVNTMWTEADEPYLFLAWCFEYREFITNPSTFVSHIPIALDATCSGIQIYSGLMLDDRGAAAVNVVNHNNNSQIADIYGEVATCVNRYLETEAYESTFNYSTADGEEHTVDFKSLGSSMIGKIDRKITKRNTMTFPYNVSTFGMKDQLMDDILNDYEGTSKQFWKEGAEKWQVATLLSRLNYKGIGEVVHGAVVCRDFLKSLTKDVIDKGDHIYYNTPIFGFPVLHRVVKTKVHRVTTALAKLSIKVPTTQLDSRKMVNGIAPNYIHSLDATLMFRTVERLLEQGVTSFALIHDSYGVHAADTEKLSKEVREAYIEIFKDNPLYDFTFQTAPFRSGDVKDILIGDLNLDTVRESDYIFS